MKTAYLKVNGKREQKLMCNDRILNVLYTTFGTFVKDPTTKIFTWVCNDDYTLEVFESEKAFRESEKILKCDDCGKVSFDVDEISCPLTEEVDKEIALWNLCDMCYQKRADEI